MISALMPIVGPGCANTSAIPRWIADSGARRRPATRANSASASGRAGGGAAAIGPPGAHGLREQRGRACLAQRLPAVEAGRARPSVSPRDGAGGDQAIELGVIDGARAARRRAA